MKDDLFRGQWVYAIFADDTVRLIEIQNQGHDFINVNGWHYTKKGVHKPGVKQEPNPPFIIKADEKGHANLVRLLGASKVPALPTDGSYMTRKHLAEHGETRVAVSNYNDSCAISSKIYLNAKRFDEEAQLFICTGHTKWEFAVMVDEDGKVVKPEK